MTIIKYDIIFTEKIIAFFVNPAVAGFLLMIIMAGIYFELQSPGIGFPIAASIIAALLYFTPHYLEGLAANWEIILFLVGLILVALEIFVIPGFGVPGIAGIIAIVISLTLSLVRNVDGFDFSFVPENSMAVAFLTVSLVLMISVFSIFFGGDKVMEVLFNRGSIGLSAEQTREDGFVAADVNKLNSYLGKDGIAQTDLRPAGKILIENEWLDAQSDGEFIPKGSPVLVTTVSGAYLIVELKR